MLPLPQVVPIALEDSCAALTGLYLDHVTEVGTAPDAPSVVTLETAYQKKVESMLTDDNCYKVVLQSVSYVLHCEVDALIQIHVHIHKINVCTHAHA